MIDTNKLKALAKECHATNVKNGFWDIEIPAPLRLLLITTEISEAIEALRKNNYTKINLADYEFNRGTFNLHIKDTMNDEIADTCIRIFDYCEGYRIRLDYGFVNPVINPIKSNDELWRTFIIIINWLIESDFNNAIYHLFKIAHYYNFDLIKHIELKNEYNKTREYLHGKQF